MRRVRERLRAGWGADALAVLSLWGLVLGLFWRIALAGRVLAGGDVFAYFYPYWAHAARALRAGRLPLWNPYLFMGAPFLANSQVGFLYPLNWPLWLALPAARAVHLTVVLHLGLAALNAYLWARRSLRLGRWGAWGTGAVFALGGYLGAQVEHVNQLQGLAWLPLLLLLYDASARARERRLWGRFCWALAALAGVLGLVLLAGHAQTAFVGGLGLALYALSGALWVRDGWRSAAAGLLTLVLAALLGALLAGAQLWPTWELSRHSIRAQGLPFNERVSFSLPPPAFPYALLPRWAGDVPPAQIEYVAYVGVVGLLLSWLALRRWRAWRPAQFGALALVGGGFFLALGLYNPLYLLLARFVPGFSYFRAPARWLALAALGLAGLAGVGLQDVRRRASRVRPRALVAAAAGLVALGAWAAVGARWTGGPPPAGRTLVGWGGSALAGLALLWLAGRFPRVSAAGLALLLVAELAAAAASLPHTRATAPQAFTGMRPAIAHLRAGPPDRFLSMSDITFDPGDLAEIRVIYGPQLSPGALYDYVVATKQKEVLSPNLPLAFEIPAVDGYGGGVLPLARYVALQRLLLPAGDLSLDGRLRENLTAVPDGRWLSLFNVRYVITDKLRDAWLDDVFYDLQLGATLAEGQSAAVAHVPRFEATALGVVSYLRGAEDLPGGTVVGAVEVHFGDAPMRTFELRAGEQTAEGLHGPAVAHPAAEVGGHFWPGEPQGNDYVARLRWEEPSAPVSVTVRATLPRGELVVRGLSLIDERTGGFQSLVISDRGHFRLTHSGDVKIYENVDVLPRAFVVRRATAVPDDDAALAALAEPSFDPACAVVLSAPATAVAGAPGACGASGGAVRVVHDAPERVELAVEVSAPGYLVLTDAWYPGWRVTVDGEPAPVLRANLLFRAVALEPGAQRVVFTFRPASLRGGLVCSAVGLLSLALLGVGGKWSMSRRRAEGAIAGG
jgi:hypothetical protein